MSNERLVEQAHIEVIKEVEEAIKDAHRRHPETHPSLEHSLAVLEEEVDELREELHKPERWRSVEDICEEACQVAASAIRLIADMRVRKAEGYNECEHYTHE